MNTLLFSTLTLAFISSAHADFHCGKLNKTVSLVETNQAYVITFTSNPNGDWPEVAVNEVLGIKDKTQNTRLTFAKGDCGPLHQYMLECRGVPLKAEYSKYWLDKNKYYPIIPEDTYFEIREVNRMDLNQGLTQLLEVEIAMERNPNSSFLRTTVEFKRVCPSET